MKQINVLRSGGDVVLIIGQYKIQLTRPEYDLLRAQLVATAEIGATPADGVAGPALVHRKSCEACGVPLMLVVGPNGKQIPLDTKAPVYELHTSREGVRCRRAAGAYVTHYATCTDPGRFSRGRAASPAPPAKLELVGEGSD